MLTGANAAGDSDGIACIAGAFSGAYNGIDAIPQAWRNGVEDGESLVEIAKDLWGKARRS